MIRKVGCVRMLVVRAFDRDSMHAGNPLGTASRSASHDVRCLPPCMDTTCAGRSAAPALVGVDGGVRRGRAQGCMLAQLLCRDGCGGRGLIPVPQANRPGGLLHVCACRAIVRMQRQSGCIRAAMHVQLLPAPRGGWLNSRMSPMRSATTRGCNRRRGNPPCGACWLRSLSMRRVSATHGEHAAAPLFMMRT